MIIQCTKCGKDFKKKPYAVVKENFCSKECRSDFRHVVFNCDRCGKETRRQRSEVNQYAKRFCGSECQRAWNGERVRQICIEKNPTKMKDIKIRLKLHNAHKGKGGGKSYPKLLGRHAHRVIAEETLQRPLLPGEVVHHIDEDILNYHPDNLQVLAGQSDHCKIHNFGGWNKKEI